MTKKIAVLVAIVSLQFYSSNAPANAQQEIVIPDYVTNALNDPGRPDIDKFRDDRRKPGATVTFAGVAPGMVIAELIPGTGYFTRILSKVVGDSGRIYTIPFREPRAAASRALAENQSYANITLVNGTPTNFGLPEKVDLVWTTQNYHDVRNLHAQINRQVFESLRPGGTYFIVDHSAKPNAEEESISLHRIDKQIVIQQVTEVGFVLEAESDILRNPNDDLTLQVFERDLNRNTDQFVLKFQKPR